MEIFWRETFYMLKQLKYVLALRLLLCVEFWSRPREHTEYLIFSRNISRFLCGCSQPRQQHFWEEQQRGTSMY